MYALRRSLTGPASRADPLKRSRSGSAAEPVEERDVMPNRRTRCVSFWPPKGSQEPLIVSWAERLMKHYLDVGKYCDWLFSKAYQPTSKVVHMFKKLKDNIIQ